MAGVKLTLAKTAGFCFGVDRAVKLLNAHLEAGKAACTLGPLIHNPGFISELETRGVRAVRTPEEAVPGTTLFIRTHGVPRETQARIAALHRGWSARLHRELSS